MLLSLESNILVASDPPSDKDGIHLELMAQEFYDFDYLKKRYDWLTPVFSRENH